MRSAANGYAMLFKEASAKGVPSKRDSVDSDDSPLTDFDSIFDAPALRLDDPTSPLSEAPDTLSDSSEARADPLLDARTRRRIARSAKASSRTKSFRLPSLSETDHVSTRYEGTAYKRRKAATRRRTSSARPRQKQTPTRPHMAPSTRAQTRAGESGEKRLFSDIAFDSPPISSPKRSKILVLRVPNLSQVVPRELLHSPQIAAETSIPSPSKRSKILVLNVPDLSHATAQKPPTPASTPEDVQDSTLHIQDQVQELHKLAAALQSSSLSRPAGSKPEASGRPEVWADGRQELCETVHYFRAFHGGSHSNNGHIRGFMFDKDAHHRDYTDSTVIISRAGGGLTLDKVTKRRTLQDDHKEGIQTEALRNTMRYYNPVVIVSGENNPSMPSKMPHAYCVLDHFKPTHIWWEKTNGKRLQRYRFEKLNPARPSWWQPKDVADAVKLGQLGPPVTRECGSCGIESQQVYLNSWMCLNFKCGLFWKDPDTNAEPTEDQLLYDPRFLKQRTVWPNETHDYPLAPRAMELSGYNILGEDRSEACWRGIVCPLCGRCSLRLSWMMWECLNPTCTYTMIPPITFIPAKALRDPYFPLEHAPTHSRDHHESLEGVQISVCFIPGYRVHMYTIPGIDGFVAHMVANKDVVEKFRGPDDMFEELQRVDIGLRRRPLGAGVIKGKSYTRHYNVNYGMPYKFIAATDTLPFEGAAQAITDTQARLNWAAKELLQLRQPAPTSQSPAPNPDQKDHFNDSAIDLGPDQPAAPTQPTSSALNNFKPFNEVLALGYFAKQSINYHDDGEYGLGPTIATLSLGAPGTMRIRMKDKHFHGKSKAGVYTDALPLPGCEHYAQRLAYVDELTALKASGDGRAYRARLKEIPGEIGLEGKGHARDAIQMTLAHGDVVVMHGEGVQKYYEHSVESAGKLRFALTCRYIDPESVGEGQGVASGVGEDSGMFDETVI